MSHLKIKTKYYEEGGTWYGSEEILDLYCHHNYSSDVSSFYDSNGDLLFVVHNTAKFDLAEAIQKLMHPYKEKYSTELIEGVETWSKEDYDKIEKK